MFLFDCHNSTNVLHEENVDYKTKTLTTITMTTILQRNKKKIA